MGYRFVQKLMTLNDLERSKCIYNHVRHTNVIVESSSILIVKRVILGSIAYIISPTLELMKLIFAVLVVSLCHRPYTLL